MISIVHWLTKLLRHMLVSVPRLDVDPGTKGMENRIFGYRAITYVLISCGTFLFQKIPKIPHHEYEYEDVCVLSLAFQMFSDHDISGWSKLTSSLNDEDIKIDQQNTY